MSSSCVNNEMLATKDALMTALGDQTQNYFNNMNMWLRKEWTKERFYMKSKKLFTSDNMYLHKTFFLLMVRKIDKFSRRNIWRQKRMNDSSLNDHIKNYKIVRQTPDFINEFAEFLPNDFLEDLEENIVESTGAGPSNSTNDNPQPKLYIKEIFLKDIGFIMARFLIGAWQEGVTDVDTNVIELVCYAKQVLLKNIISAIIMKRKPSRLTGEGTYYYDVGASSKDIRNRATTQTSNDIPIQIDKENTSSNLSNKTNDSSTFLASSEELYPQRKHLITLRDLYNTLKDRNLIPSHYIYHINMERIIHKLR